MNISEIVSYFISGASVVIALWQIRRNSNLKKYLKLEAMELYSDTGLLLGYAQACLREINSNNTSLFSQEAGKTEGISQALFTRSIKNIHHHFNFTIKDVDMWIDNNKIRSFHRDAFLGFAEK